MSDKEEVKPFGEKHAQPGIVGNHVDLEDRDVVVGDQNQLHRELKGRHMQMIAM